MRLPFDQNGVYRATVIIDRKCGAKVRKPGNINARCHALSTVMVEPDGENKKTLYITEQTSVNRKIINFSI